MNTHVSFQLARWIEGARRNYPLKLSDDEFAAMLQDMVPDLRAREEIGQKARDYGWTGARSGMFTSLALKAEVVKTWPGIDPRVVDAAVRRAREEGMIASFDARKPYWFFGSSVDRTVPFPREAPYRSWRDTRNWRYLDLVIVVRLGTWQETLAFALQRLEDAGVLKDVFADGDVSADFSPGHVSLLETQNWRLRSEHRFTPNTITVELVDFGCQENDELEMENLQHSSDPTDFAVLYNAVLSPRWHRSMRTPRMLEECRHSGSGCDDDHAPPVIAASLELYDGWRWRPLMLGRNEYLVDWERVRFAERRSVEAYQLGPANPVKKLPGIAYASRVTSFEDPRFEGRFWWDLYASQREEVCKNPWYISGT